MWGGRGALLGATVASCALACLAVVAIVGTLQQAPTHNAELLQQKVLSLAQQRLLPSPESLPPLPGVLASFPSLSSPSSWYISPAQQHLACFPPRSPCLASLPLQPAQVLSYARGLPPPQLDDLPGISSIGLGGDDDPVEGSMSDMTTGQQWQVRGMPLPVLQPGTTRDVDGKLLPSIANAVGERAVALIKSQLPALRASAKARFQGEMQRVSAVRLRLEDQNMREQKLRQVMSRSAHLLLLLYYSRA